jgi:hypothetical protein
MAVRDETLVIQRHWFLPPILRNWLHGPIGLATSKEYLESIFNFFRLLKFEIFAFL